MNLTDDSRKRKRPSLPAPQPMMPSSYMPPPAMSLHPNHENSAQTPTSPNMSFLHDRDKMAAASRTGAPLLQFFSEEELSALKKRIRKGKGWNPGWSTLANELERLGRPLPEHLRGNGAMDGMGQDDGDESGGSGDGFEGLPPIHNLPPKDGSGNGYAPIVPHMGGGYPPPQETVPHHNNGHSVVSQAPLYPNHNHNNYYPQYHEPYGYGYHRLPTPQETVTAASLSPEPLHPSPVHPAPTLPGFTAQATPQADSVAQPESTPPNQPSPAAAAGGGSVPADSSKASPPKEPKPRRKRAKRTSFVNSPSYPIPSPEHLTEQLGALIRSEREAFIPSITVAQFQILPEYTAPANATAAALTLGSIFSDHQPDDARSSLQKRMSQHVISVISDVDGYTYVNRRSASNKGQGWSWQYLCKQSVAAAQNQRNTNESTSAKKFDCEGLVDVAFSNQGKSMTVKYRHHAVHRSNGGDDDGNEGVSDMGAANRMPTASSGSRIDSHRDHPHRLSKVSSTVSMAPGSLGAPTSLAPISSLAPATSYLGLPPTTTAPPDYPLVNMYRTWEYPHHHVPGSRP